MPQSPPLPIFPSPPLSAEILNHPFDGSGTVIDPYIIEFIPSDPDNPQLWPTSRRWIICLAAAATTFIVTFCSSTFVGAEVGISAEFAVSHDIANLGLVLFLVGYVIGPLIWGPLSEVYGRRNLMVSTLGAMCALNFGVSEAPNITVLLVCRFLASIFGSSPLTCAGGAVADLFSPSERGLPMAIFAAGPFMGPVLGPIVGGYVGEYAGWRWVLRVMAITSTALWIVGVVVIPETYVPVILERRAATLSASTGKDFCSRLQADGCRLSVARRLRTALSRPWVLLCVEPIVSIVSLYMALVYGTLYMMFGAFPIVYQQNRGWSAGQSGLAFLGIAVGVAAAIAILVVDERKRYRQAEREALARGEEGAPPEARLPPAILGSVLMPVSLFVFAWTNGASVHWIVSILATVPFGCGMLLVFIALTQYLVDVYTVYAASVLAGSAIVRSLFGAAFPVFTGAMYRSLGIHWASSVPAFLALVCAPFPLLFYKRGYLIRLRSKWSRLAADEMDKLRTRASRVSTDESELGKTN